MQNCPLIKYFLSYDPIINLYRIKTALDVIFEGILAVMYISPNQEKTLITFAVFGSELGEGAIRFYLDFNAAKGIHFHWDTEKYFILIDAILSFIKFFSSGIGIGLF